MKSGFLRLLSITLFVCAFAFILVGALNFLASQTAHAPMVHPLLKPQSGAWKSGGEVFSYEIQSVSPAQKSELEQVLSRSEKSLADSEAQTKVIPKLKLEKLSNGQWVVPLQNGSGDHVTLKSFLQTRKPQALAIDVAAAENPEIKVLVATLFDFGLDEKVVALSREYKTLKRLRKKAPRWLYVASETTKMKVKVMSSVMLEAIVTFDFDIWPISRSELQSKNFNPRLIEELRRRHKLVLLRENSSAELLADKLAGSLNGLIVERQTPTSTL